MRPYAVGRKPMKIDQALGVEESDTQRSITLTLATTSKATYFDTTGAGLSRQFS